jgi:hypothetical protein
MLVDAVAVRALPVAASCGGVVYSLGASAGLTLASKLGPAKGWRAPFYWLGAIGTAFSALGLVLICFCACCCSCEKKKKSVDSSRGGRRGQRQQRGRPMDCNSGANSDSEDDDGDGDDDDDDDDDDAEKSLFGEKGRAYGAWAFLGGGGGKDGNDAENDYDYGEYGDGGDYGDEGYSLSSAMSQQAFAAVSNPLAGTMNRHDGVQGRGRGGQAGGRDEKGKREQQQQQQQQQPPRRRVGCCYLLCCVPTITLVLAATLITSLPAGVLDAFWCVSQSIISVSQLSFLLFCCFSPAL